MTRGACDRAGSAGASPSPRSASASAPSPSSTYMWSRSAAPAPALGAVKTADRRRRPDRRGARPGDRASTTRASRRATCVGCRRPPAKSPTATSRRRSRSPRSASSPRSPAPSTRCSGAWPSSTSARKQFIANASHELRTPIFSLGGFVELLEEEDPSPAEREEFVRTMRQQIERLTKLTTDLLDLSQLDAGAMVMSAGSVDLGDLAREAAREFGPRAEAHGSRLQLRTAERPVIALADRERVRQIIRILLDNALTHTPEGTEISVTANSSSRRRAELIVSDQGPGIPQRVQGRIFERFYTGDSSGGSGLGLAIATELAQRMDGRITISSSRRFTAFTLELPQARPTAGGAAAAARQGRPCEAPRRPPTAALLPWSAVLAARAPRRLRQRHLDRDLQGQDERLGRDDDDANRRRSTTAEAEAEAAEAPPVPPEVAIETGSPGFNAAEIYQEALPGVVTIRSVFGGAEGGAEGSGFVLDAERRNRHQRPRRHRRRIERDPQAGDRSLHRILEPQRARSGNPRLRPVRRRRPAEGRTGRLPAAPARTRRRHRTRSRRAGGGDRQPLRRAALALGRRRLGHRPLGQIADPVPDRGRDPDRRLDQPRQLGRPAAGRRTRRWSGSTSRSRPTPAPTTGSASRCRSRRSNARWRSCAKRAPPNTPTSASPAEPLYPQLAQKLGLDTEFGALVATVVPGGPADEGGAERRRRLDPLPGGRIRNRRRRDRRSRRPAR